MNQLIDDLERSVAELKLGYFVRIVKRADRLKVIQSENRLVGSAGNRQAIPNELRIFAMPNALDEIGLVARAPAISVHTIIRCNQYRWCGGILRRSLGQRRRIPPHQRYWLHLIMVWTEMAGARATSPISSSAFGIANILNSFGIACRLPADPTSRFSDWITFSRSARLTIRTKYPSLSSATLRSRSSMSWFIG